MRAYDMCECICRLTCIHVFSITVCIREGNDRTVLTLPGYQVQLMQAVKSAAKGHVIACVMTGGPVDISWAKVRILYGCANLSISS